MSYRVRCTGPSGSTYLCRDVFATRRKAERMRDSWERWGGGCFRYTVEEVPDVPEPGSTAAHHVEVLMERVKELEAVQKAMHRDLLFALEIGQAMREAMRTGEWRAGHDRSMTNSAVAGWDRWKSSLAKAPSVPVGASEAPGEGGDSDRRRLEALRAFLDGNEDASLSWWEGEFHALAEDVAITAPTLAALADTLAEREGRP